MFTSQALSTLAVAMLSMAPTVRSHMVLDTPKPFGSPDNSPLDASGSNYPCKMTSGTPGDGPMNDFKVGSQQQLKFAGSAVHGGGSCQISVTTDKNPTKDSVFKVIHSIEGGCPGVNGPAEFNFKVPDALPNGEMVMAWTWFNHIGNREMYMNCANIQVSGGASDNSKFEKLPDMTIANVNVGKGASCKTAESSDYTFDGVGKNGDTVERVGSGPFVDVCGGQASPDTGSGSGSGSGTGSGSESGSGSGAGAGAGSGNNGQYTPGPGEGGAPATSAAPVASAPAATGGAGGVFAPGASSAPAVSSPPAAAPTDAVTSTVNTLITVTASNPPAAAPTGAPVETAPAASPTGAPVESAPAAAPTGGASAGSSTCTNNGAVVCNGDSSFGLCDNGKVVWQAVAAGTKCENGKIAKREFVHRAQRSII